MRNIVIVGAGPGLGLSLAKNSELMDLGWLSFHAIPRNYQ